MTDRDTQRRPVQGWEGHYYEDFSVGEVYKHPYGRTVTETNNVWFTNLTMNVSPVHFNEAYAAETELRTYNQDDELVSSLERTPMVPKREHVRPSPARPTGWPEGIGTQPGDVE